ncbi:MAG TPA: ATP-dependent RNA helicase HrpA [Candidatus Sulfotelmatobacter sp.]|jgi:ATP-dependent helicase HrpA|nr:ATP-dependent RNA helicase HrpA [Candidatus Sulfotelmatobacter sp.]
MNDPRTDEIRQLLPRAMTHDWVRLGGRMVRLLRDKLHPDAHKKILSRIHEQVVASVLLREERQAGVPQITYPPELPITARKDDIVAAIRANQVVVIAGETGSGKTTQIPKMCLEAGLGIEAKIGCTQPRRVAALSISRRIAEELNLNWGREIGCQIRFDDRSSPQTYIKLMTDGILLAETQGDPLLSGYNCIIIDEAHERSLNIDFLLGYLKGLLGRRPDLKLIITSATIDTTTFSKHFNDAPVIEVSGRTFPVEVLYAPLDENSEEEGDLTYVDAAVRATEQIVRGSSDGDVLIFMPGERDIRETGDLLAGRFSHEAEIIPLFGMLSAGEQQRVFAPCDRRKIVIATNIAETSLTIPGIRYVVDAGLARVSRYNSRTRTRRLPVEEISQSSANQRKGRAGRVEAGICVRLYSEEDFNERPPYTQPEIQRANLAEVILRMKAFRLGDIETFPFVNPPPPAAIDGGYRLLQELGALDDARQLTARGESLSRLPIDPTLGRMLLQSQHEHATHELLIIAAGLGIQDPRERPADRRDAAAAAHKRFTDPRSDFLTLLKIWDAVHDEWEKQRTQNQRRKFCKANFLSYQRMREWQDLYAQLHGALEELGRFQLNESGADYAAIHRSILTGLLAHIALRKERNVYQGIGNRQLAMFPGSALFDRNEKPARSKPQPGQPPPKPVPQPPWIVAGEIVETSQLFARMTAGIDPLWIPQLAPHLCVVKHENPQWIVTAGNVLVDEIITLYGLEVSKKKVSFGNLNPAEATEIFIRSALVEESLLPSQLNTKPDENDDDDTRVYVGAQRQPALPPQYSFLEHNHNVRHKIETWQTRVRRHDLGNLDEKLFEFYAQKIHNVSSVHELNRLIRDCGGNEFLRITEADLTGGTALDFDSGAFPDAVPLGGQPVAVSYVYSPGEEPDGATVKLGFTLAQTVSQASVEWSVPGLREELVNELLRALPKSLRRELQPLPPKVAEIVAGLQPQGESLQADLAAFIRKHYGVEIPLAAWPLDGIPAHLRPRIEVVGNDRKTIGTGRDLGELRQTLEQMKVKPAPDNSAWVRVAKQWERTNVTAWDFGDLPERITVSENGPVPVYAWPGLALEKERISVRLFRTEALAREQSLGGIQKLVELALSKDFTWLHRDLRELNRFDALIANLVSHDELQRTAYENLKRHVLPAEVFWPLSETEFTKAVQATRLELPGLAQKLIDQAGVILRARKEIQARCGAAPVLPVSRPKTFSDLSQLSVITKDALKPTNPWAEELESLLPGNFLLEISFAQLSHIPRYLKALAMRMDRAKLNPGKEKERAALVAPYLAKLQALRENLGPAGLKKQAEEFRWMVEEYKVSVFAQEVGTAYPVSPKRLDEKLAGL